MQILLPVILRSERNDDGRNKKIKNSNCMCCAHLLQVSALPGVTSCFVRLAGR